jgi:hypothetical protein
VIGPTGAVRVMVATKPVDFRKGAEGFPNSESAALRPARIPSPRPTLLLIKVAKKEPARECRLFSGSQNA